MVPILFEETFRIPATINDLESFRRWARSDDFPEHGRFAFLRGELWMDMSMEQAFTHNRVKTRINSVLDDLIVAAILGYYFSDGMFLSNAAVTLSTVPDGMFVSYESLRSGRVRLVEGAEEGFVEVEGTPDMALEVVSAKSVRKDTRVLRGLYWEAGIPEYWLVDARGRTPRFEILRHGTRGYTATRSQGGWVRSHVFGRSFRFKQRADPLGNPLYDLAVQP
jgi:Uma2 family endonuclease